MPSLEPSVIECFEGTQGLGGFGAPPPQMEVEFATSYSTPIDNTQQG